MAYSSTNPPMLLDDGYGTPCPRQFFYGSTHIVSDIIATGFFVGCGPGSRTLSSGLASQVGMRIGDLVIHRSSTDAAVPGRVTQHSVTGSTPDQASTNASSAWIVQYNVTISST